MLPFPLRRTVMMGLLCGLGASVAGQASAQTPKTTLHGSVVYRERMAIPPATVELRIVDLTGHPTQPKTIARSSFATTRQVPIPFQITLNRNLLKSGRTYGLTGTIQVNGQPWFKTPMPAPINLTSDADIVLTVRRHGGKQLAPSLTGSWHLEKLGDTALKDGTPSPTLELHDDGSVAGTTICNQINSTMTVAGQTIQFAPVATTRRACLDTTTAQRERAFLVGLENTRNWQIAPTGDVLVLSDGQNQPLMVFHRQSHLPVK
ncbi:hypothetical protein HK13_04300 [Acetobacter indonesiensis]|uniref:META domain-containing protein n=1 Tax=Acetobacter indonesiensis TaxID=104101 RepID=UPI000A36E576|nr:META domain-containing protein [Acetobacter indonesiensis]OUI94754.1 hypothetical protein HK13_04300 [Acetobacter indonesiensis]